jgi:hypothetical protein
MFGSRFGIQFGGVPDSYRSGTDQDHNSVCGFVPLNESTSDSIVFFSGFHDAQKIMSVSMIR